MLLDLSSYIEMKLASLSALLLPSFLGYSLANNNSSSASDLPFPITPDTNLNDANYIPPIFPILPFEKYPGNPILTPDTSHDWESAYLYNPTAIVLNETIFLLYRAQNESKTSSIGLAWSTDGTSFTRLERPIIYATEEWETIGGTEGESPSSIDTKCRSPDRPCQRDILRYLHCIQREYSLRGS